MSTLHDARLVPVAAAAWCGAAAATHGAPWLAWAVAALAVLAGVAAGAVTSAKLSLAGSAPVRHRRHASAQGQRAAVRRESDRGRSRVVRRAALSGPTCALVALVVAAIATVSTARSGVSEASAAAMAGAESITATVRVDGEPRPRGGDAGWMVPVAVVRWEAACDAAPCAAGRGGGLSVVLDHAAVRGAVYEVGGSVSRADGEEAVMWRPREVRPEDPDVLTGWRISFAAATEHLEPRTRGLLRGIIVGDTTSMPPSQVADVRTAGLAHLTAVSGAHFAVVLGAMAAALGAVRARGMARAAVLLGVALGLAAIVGHEPSVVRALAMACAVALGAAWGRPARGLAALCAGMIALLILDPTLAASYGFAMSVSAVAAIVLWAPVLARAMARKVPPGLARVASIPLAASLAVHPILVLIEPVLAPYTVPANVVAGVAVLPAMLVGLLTLLVAPVSLAAGQLLADLGGVVVGAIDLVARVAASAPGARLDWPAGPAGAALAGLVLAGAIMATMQLPGPARTRRALAAVAAVVASASLVAGISAGPTGDPVLPRWDVVACDVGQGDMLLLRAGPSSAVVIDTGPSATAARACLDAHGVVAVPLLVVTHPHADHDGGVAGVLAVARVDEAWVGAGSRDARSTALLSMEGVGVSTPRFAATATRGTVAITVVSRLHADAGTEGNDASIAVLGTAAGATVLALGDLESRGQAEVADALGDGVTVDAVKVAHHGSADQDPRLASLVRAQVALVSAGADNRYGHPSPEALRLYGADAVILRTDTCGTVAVARDAGEIAWSECPTDVAR
ncbi:ComEC/Rec2 family competence protein [Demequina sp. NBRC 110056]|uniref:ComEC/Rec2 family competence protein n=1 Tax=Demequina sp. NBRC 110056 TaxID=1570345 RepID=UPI0009FF6E92|nr:ComEC/Rec2 family competence protein [Demequina sp. NBRC 110056]